MGVRRGWASAFAILALAGCGTHRAPVLAPPPFWIDNEERPDGLGATGLAPVQAQGDLALQRAQAVADARARLAAKVKARARNLCARLRPQLLAKAPDGSAQPVDPEVMRRFTEDVLKALGPSALEEVTVSAFWEDPVDHTLYVFATVSRATVASALATAVEGRLQALAQGGGPGLALAPGALEEALAAANPS